jgi:hypothetical protein
MRLLKIFQVPVTDGGNVHFVGNYSTGRFLKSSRKFESVKRIHARVKTRWEKYKIPIRYLKQRKVAAG